MSSSNRCLTMTYTYLSIAQLKASSVLDVVIGEIGAAPDEADAERGLGDDHDSTLGRHSSMAWL